MGSLWAQGSGQRVAESSGGGSGRHNQELSDPKRSTVLADLPRILLVLPTRVDAGSATVTSWIDVDALQAVESFYYRVRAENAGGSE